ncbi:unnamed protein product [Oikopleura dioica]|uniref:Uncharacterized protein n=1 Tax=Oikopleura dioica TaxID=34765 RepID=E4YZK0_OIKDI|nr:unnamed protein product [Oikopleura dioica]
MGGHASCWRKIQTTGWNIQLRPDCRHDRLHARQRK